MNLTRTLLLLTMLLLALPVHAQDLTEPARLPYAQTPASPDLTIVGSMGGLHGTDANAGLADAILRWRIGTWAGLQLNGRAGYMSHELLRSEGILALALGPMGQWLVGNWQVHSAVQATHVHYTSMESWMATPMANMAGDSSGSVMHRTGVEVSAGVTWPVLHRWERWQWIVETDLFGNWLPTSPTLNWGAGVRLGVGLQRLAKE